MTHPELQAEDSDPSKMSATPVQDVIASAEPIDDEQSPCSAKNGGKQADVLLELSEDATLFHAADGRGYADIMINGHRETWPLRSTSFKRWLSYSFYETQGTAAGSDALTTALGVLEAKAQFRATERPIFLRVATLKDRLYLDLLDDQWRAVEIDATGWRIINNPPIRFRRSSGMLACATTILMSGWRQLGCPVNCRLQGDIVATTIRFWWW